jgi:hypothetical protein
MLRHVVWKKLTDDHPDDEGSKHLGKRLPDYTVQHPRDSRLHTRRRENLKSHIKC